LSYGGRLAFSKVIPFFVSGHTADCATPPRATFKHFASMQQLHQPLLSLYHYPSVTQLEADMGLEIWREIITEYNGRAIKGSFKFLDGVVTVRTLRGSKAAQVRGQTPEQLAKTLLRELARDGMA